MGGITMSYSALFLESLNVWNYISKKTRENVILVINLDNNRCSKKKGGL